MNLRRLAAFLLLLAVASAADLGPELLTAARKGQTTRVQELAKKGASLESRDKNGRTALMLAAQHGHGETVRALLSIGAKTDSRDKEQWTAYGLALFSSGGDREEILAALPAPPRVRLVLNSVLGPENLYSSCLMPPPQLAASIQSLQPDARLVAAIRDVAASAKTPVELTASNGDATLSLRVRPRAVCIQQVSGDQLSMEVDARLTYDAQTTPVLEKTYGVRRKGLREQLVTSPAQYAPVFEEWAKKRAGEIYWSAVEAILRHPPRF